MKICTKCREKFPATVEYFHIRKLSDDGLAYICKNCSKLYNQEHYQKNKERKLKYGRHYNKNNKEKKSDNAKMYYQENKNAISEKSKEYYLDNKERINNLSIDYYNKNKKQVKSRQINYYTHNKEKILAKSKQYYEENKQKVIERGKIHYKNNRNKILLQKKEYNKNNPQVRVKATQRRKAREKEVISTLTDAQWNDIKQDFNSKCAYCGMSEAEHFKRFNQHINQEHFIPLSKGGGYTHNNIIPSCRSCNSSKGDKDFSEWYPTHEYYNVERNDFILNYLGYMNKTQQLSIL